MGLRVAEHGASKAWRAWQLLAAAGLATSLSACDLEPCGPLELAGTHTRGLAEQGPTVIAVSDGAHVEVIRTCARPDCGFAELEVQSLELNAAPDQLMLTASGRWLTYRVGSVAYRIDLDARLEAPPEDGISGDWEAGPATLGATAVGVPGNVDELIGSLRGGDWLIYRNHMSERSELWAVYVGDPAEQPELATQRQFRLGPGTDLRVVAMGHRHIVARHRLDGGNEELYLVRIAPARASDVLGGSSLGEALLLATGPSFRRVVITQGPTPTQLGQGDDFPQVPTDVQVIATSGRGADARTVILSVADRHQIANFSGEVVTSLNALEDVPGLSPISPDGNHLAYITARGSLALRNLDDQRSCTIRPASATRHVIAGFAADGTIYFGAEEGTGEVVYAYDPSTRAFTALTKQDETWRLQAVPPMRYALDESEVVDRSEIPWAVIRKDDLHAGRPLDTPDDLPVNLSLEKTSFLPRGDETLWLLEATEQTYGEPSRLDLRRIQPVAGDGVLDFDITDANPTVCDPDCSTPHPYSHQYSSIATTVCVSVSQSETHTTPWATQCSEPDNPKRFLDMGPPAGELGP